jgi:hypothetical protein
MHYFYRYSPPEALFQESLVVLVLLRPFCRHPLHSGPASVAVVLSINLMRNNDAASKWESFLTTIDIKEEEEEEEKGGKLPLLQH